MLKLTISNQQLAIKFLLLFSSMVCGLMVQPLPKQIVPPESCPWPSVEPEEVGLSDEKLRQLVLELEQRGTKKLMIIKNDQLAFEWFAAGWKDSERNHYTASMAKALVGGMSLALALDQHLIAADMPACTFIPEWKRDPKKSKITIRQLATHTSGLEDAEVKSAVQQTLKQKGIDPHKGLPGWKGQFWRQDPDPFLVSRDSTKVLFEPGSQYCYSNPGIGMLSYAVTASLEQTEFDNLRSYLFHNLYQPLGVTDQELSIGYGKTIDLGGLKLVPSWGGGSATACAVAKVGSLMLNQGKWQGGQLVSETTVSQVLNYVHTAKPGSNPDYVSEESSLRTPNNPQPLTTMGWYSNFDKVWEHLPSDAFVAAGAGHQLLLVVPSMELIVVRFGDDLSGDSEDWFWGDAEQYLFNPIMDAIDGQPYESSTDIIGVEFAPEDETIRIAEGSDNWPMTWADDNNLYTAYGDGWGFEPLIDLKLSLGLSRVEGYPPDIKGVNLRTPSGERVGQGKFGVKASGMLAVDDVIYMLVRNAENAQLAWSSDKGNSWTWADWRFDQSFGCPTFLNFGKNYQGARDEYVYIFTPDQPTAYKVADHMVLARVHKDKIQFWQAYEFFSGFNQENQPIWTEDIRKREPVFTNPGRCYRSGISFNAGLGKYMWTQILPLATDDQGPRFKGGLGIFVSENPWGPWETVYYTREWDMGPGETASIPTKWISEDGLTFYLVFSGEDYFSVRKGTLAE